MSDDLPSDTYLSCSHSKWDSRQDCLTCLRFAVQSLNEMLAKARQEQSTAESETEQVRELLRRKDVAGAEFLEAAEALFNWMNGNDLSADHKEQYPADFQRLCAALVNFKVILKESESSKAVLSPAPAGTAQCDMCGRSVRLPNELCDECKGQAQ